MYTRTARWATEGDKAMEQQPYVPQRQSRPRKTVGLSSAS